MTSSALPLPPELKVAVPQALNDDVQMRMDSPLRLTTSMHPQERDYLLSTVTCERCTKIFSHYINEYGVRVEPACVCTNDEFLDFYLTDGHGSSSAGSASAVEISKETHKETPKKQPTETPAADTKASATQAPHS